LATIAAVGSASAQGTISGQAAWGFLSTTDSTGASTSGFGIDTAQLKFAASEDLGNGMKVSAGLSLNTGNMGTPGTTAGASSDDQSISLTTPMATISLLTYKSADWVSQASGAATWWGLDGKVLSSRSARDAIAITMPLATGLTATAAYLEPANTLGEGAGNTGQNLFNFGLKYATGPAVLQAAFLQYNNVAKSDVASVGVDNITRLGAMVDLGVAKVGAALQLAKLGKGGTGTQTALSISAPLPGGFSAQGVFASNNLDSSSGEDLAPIGRRSGYMLGLQYNLSKRTYAILNAGSWTGQTSNSNGLYAVKASTGAVVTTTATALTNDSAASTMYALTLVHDF
jgi:hypothetical protein